MVFRLRNAQCPPEGQDSHDLQDFCPTEHDEAIRRSQTEDVNGRTGRVGGGGEEVTALERCRLRVTTGQRQAAGGGTPMIQEGPG